MTAIPMTATPATPLNVFISYSVADKIFVERLVQDLAAHQVSAWVGHMQIQGGQYWPDAVEEAIERAQVTLVIWSPNARDSKYVKKEYTHAIEHDKRVIPILIKPCKTALLLQGLHWIDFTEPQAYAERLDTLLHFLKNRDTIPVPPEPAPMPPPRSPVYILPIAFLLIIAVSFGLLASRHGPKQTTAHPLPTATASLPMTPAATAIIQTSPVAATVVVGASGTGSASGSKGNAPNGGAGTTPTPPVSPPTIAPTGVPTATPSPTIAPEPDPTRSPQ